MYAIRWDKVGCVSNTNLDDPPMTTKHKLLAASILSLSGAMVGGGYGSLVAAFAGDSWWDNRVSLGCYQHAIVLGAACVGAMPGNIWLYRLKQRWVLALLCAACGALALVPLGWIRLDNDLLGFLYPGIVAAGFVIGLSLWVLGKRSADEPQS